jgi:Tol biopolymer transport system component
MNPDGSDVRQLTDDTAFTATDISFSPDGERAVVPGPFPGPEVDGPQDPAHWWNGLYVMNAEGTDRRLMLDYKEGVPNSASGRGPFIWSPDGERLIFHRLLLPEVAGEVVPFLVNADGTNPRQLTGRGSSLQITDWSPDGEFLIGAASVPGARDSARIVKLGLEGNAVKVQSRITGCSGACGGAIISSDGRQIAFGKQFIQVDTLDNGNVFRSSQDEIYVMNADGTGKRALTNSEHQWMTPVAWSPDGTHILVDATDRMPEEEQPPSFAEHILLIAADGSGVTDISPFADAPDARPEPWDWK